MRIESGSGFPAVNTNAASQTQQSQQAKASSATTESSSLAATSESRFSPTPDLQRLLAAVRELPDVRTDVVAEASNSIANGEFETRTAAVQTASAIVDEPN